MDVDGPESSKTYKAFGREKGVLHIVQCTQVFVKTRFPPPFSRKITVHTSTVLINTYLNEKAKTQLKHCPKHAKPAGCDTALTLKSNGKSAA